MSGAYNGWGPVLISTRKSISIYKCWCMRSNSWNKGYILLEWHYQWFAWQMILGWLICQIHSCVYASKLSSIGPPGSATHKRPDNRRGEDLTFDVLQLQKPSVMQIESFLFSQTLYQVCPHPVQFHMFMFTKLAESGLGCELLYRSRSNAWKLEHPI